MTQFLPLYLRHAASALVCACARFAPDSVAQAPSPRLVESDRHSFRADCRTLQSDAAVRQLVSASCSAALCESCPCEDPERVVLFENAIEVHLSTGPVLLLLPPPQQ